MKKTATLLISILFLASNNIQASLFQSPNPYSFGPHGRTVADLRDFAKPKQMANILAGRPVVATRQDGTRVYYSSDGKLCLSIKQNGEMNFSLGGRSKTLDKFGNLKSETKTLKGNFQEIRDEFGEITGYNQLDGNGKVIYSYDKDMNKTVYYNYGKFGKTLEYSTNLMTKQKTVYDKYERAMAVYSDDTTGNYILTTYQYNDVSYETAKDRKTLVTVKNSGSAEHGGIVSSKSYYADPIKFTDGSDGTDAKTDLNIMAHKTTYYDNEGLVKYINDNEGVTENAYYYKKDTLGNKVLEYVLNTKDKTKTYYENNKQMYVKNETGTVITRYYWDGSKLLFSAQIGKNGNWISVTNNDDNNNITTAAGTVVLKDGKWVSIDYENAINEFDVDGAKNNVKTENVVYNKDGTISFVADNIGNIVERYYYKNKKLDYVKNFSDGTTTYYDDDGCATQTVNYKGEVVAYYGYNNSKKVYKFDTETKITTWYIDGEEYAYLSLNDRVISANIKVGGQLIGTWELVQGDKKGESQYDETYSLTIYVNENKRFKINYLKEVPSDNLAFFLMGEYIKTGSYSENWLIDNGYIKEDQLQSKNISETIDENNEEKSLEEK